MKRQKFIEIEPTNPFDLISDEIIFTILDLLSSNPVDLKSFSLACKSLYSVEAKHRKILKPLRSEHLPSVLKRYTQLTGLDFSLNPRVTDASLAIVAKACNSKLRSVDLSRSKLFSAAGLLSLSMNCSNLVEIDLSNATELRDTAALALAKAKNLEKLWLGRCKLITDMGIGCIAVGCTKLRFISLKWCMSIGDLGVGLIAVKCEQIRGLDLSYMPITEKCLPSILRLKYLEDLVLEGCFGIDDDCLAVIRYGCKSLKKLDVSSCPNISPTGLSSLTKATASIQQLTIAYGSPVTLALADSLKNLSMLQSVKLDGCVITYDGLKAIGNWCVSLRELSLSKCVGVTDDGLSSIANKHKDLKKLDITCCRRITDVSISHLTNSCTGLTSLKMESCSLVSREGFILIGRRCHLLEELDLTDNEIDNEGLKSLSRCSKLSILKLGICLNLNDDGLGHIGMCCSKLRELDLYRCAGVTDSGLLAIIHGCPNLEMINIAYCRDITDASFSSLCKCSRLKTIEARGCPLITSSGLAATVAGCKLLRRLDLKKCCNVDDAGMIALAHFSQNLRQINLSYSSVTDLGLLSLASLSCLQHLTILHTNRLTPSGVAAALLANSSLTKVKLHALFQALLPERLLKHLEVRGCTFEWREKIFQAELDPKCWKLQLEDEMQIVQ
ncbi:F-box/LRR-repeat protein 3 isoform X2 [Momordica charantia]|uniref:F-box/LRR-repeat protein 3 isoform X2 n=1 Tax=Momordica charantia TaxID=3673 RepID=A0A6J1DXM6_MOMCH|nr:F-box/LRR-repeat protein 3 isoform X2 [Momordica charantia]